MVIYYRTILDDLRRDDARYCSNCVSPLRQALITGKKRDRSFIKCQSCGERWDVEAADVDEAVRGWVQVFATDDRIPAALLCADCARENPDPMALPEIARLILWQSRGPVQ